MSSATASNSATASESGSGETSTSDDSGDGDGDGAETGDTGAAGEVHFLVEVQNRGPSFSYPVAGVFERPDNSSTPSSIGPGEQYTLEFDARPGDKLSLVSSLLSTNDAFLSVAPGGLELFTPAGQGINGTQSGVLAIYDAGTEADQTLGQGDQQPGGSNPASTPDPNSNVRQVSASSLGLPDAATWAELSVTSTLGPDRVWHFVATVANNSSPGIVAGRAGAEDLHISPGIYLLHAEGEPIFSLGEPARDNGLEALAEDGSPTDGAIALVADAGIVQIMSAGVWAVTEDANGFFALGSSNASETGLEALAEDGKFAALSEYIGVLPNVLADGITDMSVSDYSLGPLAPGGIYRFEFDADPGARLHIAHMFVPSNDWFIAFDPAGLELFPNDGPPITADVSEQVHIYDAATESDQRIGFGLDQVHLQADLNTGDADPDNQLREVSHSPSASQLLQVRVSATRN